MYPLKIFWRVLFKMSLFMFRSKAKNKATKTVLCQQWKAALKISWLFSEMKKTDISLDLLHNVSLIFACSLWTHPCQALLSTLQTCL